MKPKMYLKSDDEGYSLIERAGSILAAHGLYEQAEEIHQRAAIRGYDLNRVLKLLKEYMDI